MLIYNLGEIKQCSVLKSLLWPPSTIKKIEKINKISLNTSCQRYVHKVISLKRAGAMFQQYVDQFRCIAALNRLKLIRMNVKDRFDFESQRRRGDEPLCFGYIKIDSRPI